MSTQTTSKKRKSADGASAATKKIKVSKAADKPAPLKSALKKTKTSSPDENGTVSNGSIPKSSNKIIVGDNSNEDGGTELTPSQTAALLAGFSSSEDEADSDNEGKGVPLSSLPAPPSKGLIKKRISQAIADKTGDPETTPGVIYIGRIPHGFYEHQMRAYFSQFGTILHLKLARSKKTGRSQGFAFIEFESAAVSDIVAKTMDKYLLFGHILQVRRVPREQINENMWKGGRSRRKPAPRNRLEGGRLRRGATRDVWEERVERENRRRVEKAEKLKEMGYEFEMPAVKAVSEVPVKSKGIEDGAVDAQMDEGVKMIEDVPDVKPDVQTEQKVESTADGVTITEKKTKKRPAHGKTQEKKIVKKVKTQT